MLLYLYIFVYFLLLPNVYFFISYYFLFITSSFLIFLFNAFNISSFFYSGLSLGNKLCLLFVDITNQYIKNQEVWDHSRATKPKFINAIYSSCFVLFCFLDIRESAMFLTPLSTSVHNSRQ